MLYTPLSVVKAVEGRSICLPVQAKPTPVSPASGPIQPASSHSHLTRFTRQFQVCWLDLRFHENRIFWFDIVLNEVPQLDQEPSRDRDYTYSL